MANTPPEIDKYDTHKNSALQKWHACQKNHPDRGYLPRTELSDF